ncbi:lysozyme family protein [Phaeacidiphilus oryzae]|uniref:hypothetical protein n=1 Tax=Phaeacidiphilus oryzae TaxID=348818 RepID=UPI00068FE417|nr:hypothetical protein [Phaeacidiphilus oryzae]
MTTAQGEFQVQLTELDEMAAVLETAGARMAEIHQRLRQADAALAAGAARPVDPTAVTGPPQEVATVAGQVRSDVSATAQRSHQVTAEHAALSPELAEDAGKLQATRDAYAEAEGRAKGGLPGGGLPPGGPGGPSGPGGPTGPVPHPGESDAQAIAPDQVSYRDKGAWPSGEAACRQYVDQALDTMGITDPQARANWEQGMVTIMSRESAYNSPGFQVNEGDSNAHGAPMADGSPANCSRGACQTVPATFARYHQPGTSTEIYDPVANTAAAMNYCMGTYQVRKDGSNLAQNVQQADPNRPPHGY